MFLSSSMMCHVFVCLSDHSYIYSFTFTWGQVAKIHFSVCLARTGACWDSLFYHFRFFLFHFEFLLGFFLQMFLLLHLPSPCCCALSQRWCWAGGLLLTTGEILYVDTIWTRGKRVRKRGERLTSNLPKRDSLRSAKLQHVGTAVRMVMLVVWSLWSGANSSYWRNWHLTHCL